MSDSFRFIVRTAGYFPASNSWYLDGVLEEGTIRPPCRATAELTSGPVQLEVLTIALVGGRQVVEPERMTLTIQDPGIELEVLEGVELIGPR